MSPSAPSLPTNLARVGADRLSIAWSDGTTRLYRIEDLRKACPCATCREKRSQPPPPATFLPILTQAEARPLTLLGMQPVGNYAYSLNFSDGHDTGIFTFELLRQMGESQAPDASSLGGPPSA